MERLKTSDLNQLLQFSQGLLARRSAEDFRQFLLRNLRTLTSSEFSSYGVLYNEMCGPIRDMIVALRVHSSGLLLNFGAVRGKRYSARDRLMLAAGDDYHSAGFTAERLALVDGARRVRVGYSRASVSSDYQTRGRSPRLRGNRQDQSRDRDNPWHQSAYRQETSRAHFSIAPRRDADRGRWCCTRSRVFCARLITAKSDQPVLTRGPLAST
jgi:hypothetical protein